MRKLIMFMAVSGYLFSSSLYGGLPEQQSPVKQYSADVFHNTEALQGLAFNRNETAVLYASNKSGIFNIYSKSIADGKVEQLTHSEEDGYRLVSTFTGQTIRVF